MANQENKDTAVLKCKGCGANLSYAPGQLSVKCEYCSAENTVIDKDRFQNITAGRSYAFRSDGNSDFLDAEVVECAVCRVQTVIREDINTGHCPVCYTGLGEGAVYRLRKPTGILPFKITQAAALAAFKEAVNKGLLPGEVRKSLDSPEYIRGIYMPVWSCYGEAAVKYTALLGKDKLVKKGVAKSDFRRMVVDSVLAHKARAVSHFTDKMEEQVQVSQDLINYSTEALGDYTFEYFSHNTDFPEYFKSTFESESDSIVRESNKDVTLSVTEHTLDFQQIGYALLLVPAWLVTYELNGEKQIAIVDGTSGTAISDGKDRRTRFENRRLVRKILIFAVIAILVFFYLKWLNHSAKEAERAAMDKLKIR